MTATAPSSSQLAHPLEMLTGAEVTRAVEVLRGSGRLADDALFASIVLHEPHKEVLRSWKAGDPVERRVRAVVVPDHSCRVVEAVVNVGTGEIESFADVDDVRPTLLMHEAALAIGTIRSHPEFLAALERRGLAGRIDDVQIDPWPAGAF